MKCKPDLISLCHQFSYICLLEMTKESTASQPTRLYVKGTILGYKRFFRSHSNNSFVFKKNHDDFIICKHESKLFTVFAVNLVQ